MVQEAEEFAEQDKAVKAKVDARNALETYCYNMKQTIEDKLGDKLDEDDKEKVPPLMPFTSLSCCDAAGPADTPAMLCCNAAGSAAICCHFSIESATQPV